MKINSTNIAFLFFFTSCLITFCIKNKNKQIDFKNLDVEKVDGDKLIKEAASTVIKPFTQLLGEAMDKSLLSCFPQTTNLLGFHDAVTEFLSDFPLISGDAKGTTICILGQLKKNMGGLQMVPGTLFNGLFMKAVSKSAKKCSKKSKETCEAFKKAMLLKFLPKVGLILEFPYSAFSCYVGNLEKKANEKQKTNPVLQSLLNSIKFAYKSSKIGFGNFIKKEKKIAENDGKPKEKKDPFIYENQSSDYKLKGTITVF